MLRNSADKIVRDLAERRFRPCISNKGPILDFSTTIYDSTAQDNYFTSSYSSAPLTAEQSNLFLNQLLSTMDIDVLGNLYARQLRTLVPVNYVDVRLFDRVRHYAPHKSVSLASLSMPVIDRTGTEHIVSYGFPKPATHAQKVMLRELHKLFSMPLINAIEFERMKLLATKDSLTGLGNRNGFNETFARMISRAQRYQRNFGLLVIDLDNFKQVNDTLGHQEGDKVLVEMSQLIQTALRGDDEAFRFGGDEFCCILDCVQPNALQIVANRLQRNVALSSLLSSKGVSCSIGGAAYTTNESADALFGRADKALYQVKHNGKNAYLAA